ncbi:DUF1214 domain-containing protein [Sphingobium sp. EM0848]|uniref:DUF1214 domain-containing protein n=1 Tax=Sphingobium sp. EM0848 TaxID=2743473 RepID=UPI00159CA9D4|nr:DUF1214 domain-containing protein [Sphingobium sp. EM0848]
MFTHRVLTAATLAFFGGMLIPSGASASSPALERDYRIGACDTFRTQQRIERIALDLLKTPEVRKARADAERQWRAAVGPASPEMDALFPAALDELVFDGLLRAAAIAQDPPVLVSTFNLPHRLDGRMVPGSRFGWDNPDVIYGKIAIDPDASYVISGWLPRRDMQLHFSLADASDGISRNVSMRDLRPDADGRFRITLSKAEGSPADNHIRIDPTTVGITLRETLADWRQDRPVYMRIEKTGGGKSPLSQRPLPVLAAGVITGMAADIARWQPTLYANRPANVIRDPSFPTDKQGLPNQAMSLGRFLLADDEALIIDVALGGARYFTMPVTNIWGVTGDYRASPSSLNDRQTLANPDGSFTYVLSSRDPGIYNWLSTNGWHEGHLTLRWQELPPEGERGTGPSVRTRLVKLADLPSMLPAHVKRVTPAERAAQIAQRQRYPVGLWGAEQCRKGESR